MSPWVVWFARIVLAAVFAPVGGATVAGLLEKVAEKRGQTVPLPKALFRFIGAAELAGGIGVIVPVATGIAPWLAQLAAAGLAVIMVGATAINARKKAFAAVAVNIALIVLAGIVGAAPVAG